MSLFDYINESDDSVRDAASWPPADAKAEACPLCGGLGKISNGKIEPWDADPWNLDDDKSDITCPECDGSGWADEQEAQR